MASATLISRVLGLVREQVMAGLFGASGLSDAFFVAYRIPNLLRGLFAEGAFSSAFVPSFIQAKQEKGHEGARQLLWKVFFSLGIVTAILSGLLTLFAHEMVSLFVDQEFMLDLERFTLSVRLTQLMAPYLCLTSLAALMMGALNSYKSYFRPALAPAVFNIVVIICALTLPEYLVAEEGDKAVFYAVAYGIVIGGIVQLFFQIPVLYQKGLGPVSKFAHWNKSFERRIIAKMGPGVLGTAAQHMNLLVSTILATGAAAGSVSWLTYSFRLFQFPIGVIGVSIGNSFLVEFSKASKSGEHQRAREIFKGSQDISLLLLFPIAIIGFFGAEHLVKIVFERGEFTAEATSQTALALKCYMLGLPVYGYYKTLNAALYAIERAKIPVMIAAFSISFSLLVCWLTIDEYGFQVLAIGNGAVFILNTLLMGIAMNQIRGWGINDYFSARSLKLIVIGSSLAVGMYFYYPMQNPASMTSSLIFLTKLTLFVFLTIGISLLIFGERELLRRIASKFRKRH